MDALHFPQSFSSFEIGFLSLVNRCTNGSKELTQNPPLDLLTSPPEHLCRPVPAPRIHLPLGHEHLQPCGTWLGTLLSQPCYILHMLTALCRLAWPLGGTGHNSHNPTLPGPQPGCAGTGGPCAAQCLASEAPDAFRGDALPAEALLGLAGSVSALPAS